MIEQYDRDNITIEAAKEFCRLIIAGIEDDEITEAYIPLEERLSDKHTPRLVDFEQLKERVELFEKMTVVAARSLYIGVRSEPRLRVFMLKECGTYISGALWMVPQYTCLRRISGFRQVINWILAQWYCIVSVFVFGFALPSMLTKEYLLEYSWPRMNLGGLELSESIDAPATLSRKQLRDTAYPVDMCYFLMMLVTRPDMQGQGYGKRLLLDSLKDLSPHRAPPYLLGPPKACVAAASDLQAFFAKSGFLAETSRARRLPNGRFVSYTYSYKNLQEPSIVYL